jgi:ATP-dependent DNA helicase RecG
MPPSTDPPLDVNTPVQYLKGCGAPRAELLARLGVRTIRDLMFFLPRDYQDLTDLRSIAELEEDTLASVLGTVEEVDLAGRGPGKSILGVLIRQGDQHMRAVWFNQAFLKDKFSRGQTVLVSGKPRRRAIRWEMIHPHVKLVETEGDIPAGELLPVYPLTEGLNQRQVRMLTRKALEVGLDQLEEVFPPEFLREHNLLPLAVALPQLHFPASHADLEQARRRFIYQELFILQLALALKRERVRRLLKAQPLELTAKIDARIRRLLPFQLTQGQNQAIAEIAGDLEKSEPMNRLLQGDVGSGKTIVAVYAMLLAVAHGGQVVLMAPTEVLARQHVNTLEKLLAGSHTRIGLLAGGQTAKTRQEVLASVASGEIQILVGTQAVVAGEIAFHQLGLVIIDEQHKFGVRQRARLKYAGLQPHYLVMTATPIPRTISMTLFGDLDVTTLADSPPGRQSVHTYYPPLEDRAKWWEFFRKKLREGRQGYVVVPLVAEAEDGADAEQESGELAGSGGENWGDEESPAHTPPADQAAAESGDEIAEEKQAPPPLSLDAAYEQLANGELEAFRLGLVHGRMSSNEKQLAMDAFRRGEIQVLVATSVVEVGIDVPNATLMTIENADRFGLAQLHQLRGRISRGSYPGYCCLFSGATTPAAAERLQALVENRDGFRLADIDFALRGPGNVLGTRQHGLPPLRIADLVRDAEIVEEARLAARALVEGDPELADPEHARLQRMAIVRYGRSLDLGDVG